MPEKKKRRQGTTYSYAKQEARRGLRRRKKTRALAREAEATRRRLGIEILTPRQVAARKRVAKAVSRGKGRGKRGGGRRVKPPGERTVW